MLHKTSPQDQQSLRRILPQAAFYPAASDPAVRAITTDASTLKPGDLYVHLEECDATGAEWAAERGAVAVIAERLLPGLSAPLAVVEDIHTAHDALREALGPSSDVGYEPQVPTITVGGSVGRSTVVELLASVFVSAGQTLGMRNSDLEADGEGLDAPTETADELFDWLARCEANAVDIALLAMNPKMPSVQPTAGVVCLTSLRCDALQSDAERGWESVALHRCAIEDSLGHLTDQTTLVLNVDDADSLAMASKHPGGLLTYGEQSHAEVRASSVESHAGGQVFIVTHGSESAAMSVSVPGAAYRANCLAAIAASLASGLDFHTTIRGIESARSRSGMAQIVSRGQPFTLMVDRARRPLAMRAALEAARSSTDGRVLIAAALSEESSIAYEQLATAESLADRVLAWAPHNEPEKVSNNTTVVEDRLQSLALAIGLANPGDTVLVTALGIDTDDHELINTLVEHRLACEA